MGLSSSCSLIVVVFLMCFLFFLCDFAYVIYRHSPFSTRHCSIYSSFYSSMQLLSILKIHGCVLFEVFSTYLFCYTTTCHWRLFFQFFSCAWLSMSIIQFCALCLVLVVVTFAFLKTHHHICSHFIFFTLRSTPWKRNITTS
jgi:hypothetical protein